MPLNQTGPSVDEMSQIIAEATRVRCVCPSERELLYETAEPEALAQLAAALRAQPPKGTYCMCVGTLLLELEGERAVVITLHHGESLRWNGSGGDVELIDPDAVMDWLSARGMGFVREGYERERRERERAEDAFRRWRDAMPVAWVPLFDGVWVNGDLERAEWAAVLEAAIPDPVERARALLDLLGSSGGPWNETPIYELDTHELLAAMPLETLLAAIGEQPDARQCEGVGRLLCCGFFERKHGVLRDRIPKPLRDHLLAYVEQTGDADKQRTARLELGEG